MLYIPQALDTSEADTADAVAVDVDFVALSEDVVMQANQTPFARRIVQGGDLAGPARFVTESQAIRERMPVGAEPDVYTIGVGDVLTFSRIGVRVSDQGQMVDTVLTRELPVLPGGYISLLEVGRVYVEDLTIRDAQDSVSEAILRAGEDPRFELSITGFNSQKVLVGGEVSEPGAYPVTSRPLRLSELLLIAGVGNGEKSADGGETSAPTAKPTYLVRLLRGDTEYRSSVERILQRRGTGAVYLRPDDKILVERLTYRPEHVLIAGEVSQQQIFPINADTRPSLATALYATGAIDLENSNPAQIYLFRGREPVTAYHLDASDPLRLSLASEFELRPDDIVFIAAQPLTNYNRTLRRLLGTYELSNVIED
ncbi:polysaccharide biosynthesis/export family protein [Rhodovulum sp. YNF3179]|uniref:polysaccharide biosynthesis/export family protein n=1 Tax=Rhodovulum sp. YNF3179 TaxID=3425127 RepID=UPI003D35543D